MPTDLPNGVDYNTMAIALAWEITKHTLSNNNTYGNSTTDERIKIIERIYGKAMHLIIHPPKESEGVHLK